MEQQTQAQAAAAVPADSIPRRPGSGPVAAPRAAGRFARRAAALALVACGTLATTACEDDGGGDPDASSNDTGADTTPISGTWVRLGNHPCTQYRVNTAVVEDDGQRLWVGCGQGATGFGLFTSSDGGATWASPAVDPAFYFDIFRVWTLQRSADGLLYVGGVGTGLSARVVSLDTTQDPPVVATVHNAGTLSGTAFTVGAFVRTANGTALASSGTGFGLLARAADEDDFEVVDEPMTDGSNHQFLSLRVDRSDLRGNDIYGTGSTIAAPHIVMVPALEPPEDAIVSFDAVEFTTTGTLWDSAVEDGHVVAVGVEENANYGIAWVSGEDLRDPTTWTRIDARTVTGVSDRTTRFYGACRNGATIVAVGDYSQRSEALAIRSTDNGVTWEDITPPDAPILGACHVANDGTVRVLGGSGYTGVLAP